VGVRLQRHLGALRSIDKQQWFADPGWDETRPIRREIWVCCPECAGIHNITDTHRVIGGGLVSPVFSCPTAACPYQDFLELASYGEEHV
jgi:hypothetical protein